MKIVFPHHAEKRIKKRGVLKQEVIDAVNYPNKNFRKHDNYYFQKRLGRGTIEVVCDKTEMKKILKLNHKLRKKEKILKIITVYWV